MKANYAVVPEYPLGTKQDR